MTRRQNHPGRIRSDRHVLGELDVDPSVTLGRATLADKNPRLGGPAGGGRGVGSEEHDPLVQGSHRARLLGGRHFFALRTDCR